MGFPIIKKKHKKQQHVCDSRYGISHNFMKYRIESKFLLYVIRYTAQSDELSIPERPKIYRSIQKGLHSNPMGILAGATNS